MTVMAERAEVDGLRSADRIVFLNRRIAATARSLEPNLNISVLPVGVDSTVFRPKPQTTPVAANVPDTKQYLISVGRLADPRKNVRLLFRAFQEVVRACDIPPELVLVGSTMPTSSDWQYAVDLGIDGLVRREGGVDKSRLVSLLQHATALILPSLEEGLGIVLLESMSCGTPVIATRCGGPDEVVSPGRTGFLVGLNDHEGIASASYRLLHSPPLRQVMGQEARATVERLFSDEVVFPQYADIYRSLYAASTVGCRP
jgi:glycosyltransferase involved in cell wall biosynthesis